MEIFKRIEQLNAQMLEIEKNRNSLIESAVSDKLIPIEDRFKLWLLSSDKKDYRYYTFLPKNSLLRDLIDENDSLHRYSTINPCDYFEDELYFITNPDAKLDNSYNEDNYKKAVTLAEELIEFNVNTVNFDW